MSTDCNCPFCDASDTRYHKKTRDTWEDISKCVSNYFSNFTYDHYNKLCDSCFNYIQEFCNSRKIWLSNEAQIHKRRQLGQFKGLKDIVNLKKDSFLICRLCFKGSPSEEVIFIYHENKIYQPGYIQNMLVLHANNIDLNMTENPVICQECLNAIQTFDALYQMCLENQVGKPEPDLKVKSSSDSHHSPEKDDIDKIVHVQLKKRDDNSLVLHSVTEAESAVNSLISGRGSIPGGPIILNGWTTKKVIDMVQNPKSNFKNQIKDKGISSNDGKYNTSPSENIELKSEQTINKNPEVYTLMIENEDSTNSTFRNEEPESSILNTDVIQNEGCVSNLLGKSQNIQLNTDILGTRGSSSTTLLNESKTIEVDDNSSSNSDIIEIDDSDEEETIVIPSILDVVTVMESGQTVELQPQNDPGDIEEIEVNPTAEINMAAFTDLFSSNKTEYELKLRESTNTGTHIDGSEVTSVDDSSDSNTSHSLKMECKNTLEDDLSDFLQFNRKNSIDTNSDWLKRSNESMNNNETSKKLKSDTTFDKSELKSYSSAYEEFLLSQANLKYSAWKLLRGVVSHNPNNVVYCTWFPFYHNKKCFPSTKRKSYITVLENQYGSRIYRCNICLHIMEEVSSATDHNCVKSKGRRGLFCSKSKCNFYTYNDFLFSQHKKAHICLTSEEIKKYKCRFCEYYSADKKCMENHKKSVHGQGAIMTAISKCKYCFFESPNPDIVAHHITVRHSYKKTKFAEKHFS